MLSSWIMLLSTSNALTPRTERATTIYISWISACQSPESGSALRGDPDLRTAGAVAPELKAEACKLWLGHGFYETKAIII